MPTLTSDLIAVRKNPPGALTLAPVVVDVDGEWATMLRVEARGCHVDHVPG